MHGIAFFHSTSHHKCMHVHWLTHCKDISLGVALNWDWKAIIYTTNYLYSWSEDISCINCLFLGNDTGLLWYKYIMYTCSVWHVVYYNKASKTCWMRSQGLSIALSQLLVSSYCKYLKTYVLKTLVITQQDIADDVVFWTFSRELVSQLL